MSSEIVDELTKDYLARLDRVAHQLPRQRRGGTLPRWWRFWLAR
jgi:hypothetical protein